MNNDPLENRRECGKGHWVHRGGGGGGGDFGPSARLVAWCNSNPMIASGPTPLSFPVWLGIPKPMIPRPLLLEGAVRTIGSHLGRIPNCMFGGARPPPTPGPTPLPPKGPAANS